MTRLQKLAEMDAMARFLNRIVQDCDFCPCMEDGICEGSCADCIENFKIYLSKKYMDYSVKEMTRSEMIEFIVSNPYTKITHSLFSNEEYLYSDENGNVYDENDYLFEDWQGSEWNAHNGIRMRKGGAWESGWSVVL